MTENNNLNEIKPTIGLQEYDYNAIANVDFSGNTKAKNGLTYLSWAYAWGAFKKVSPTASSKVYEDEHGRIYWTDGKTCWVKVGASLLGVEHIEYLPVMDNKNQSVDVDKITSVQVNKAIQRALTKAIARHGIGLYIYAGEDLPEDQRIQENKISIDINAAQQTSLKAQFTAPANDADFQQLRTTTAELAKKIISFASTLSDSAAVTLIVTNYLTNNFAGIRVSESTEAEKIFRAKVFFEELGKQLNAN